MNHSGTTKGVARCPYVTFRPLSADSGANPPVRAKAPRVRVHVRLGANRPVHRRVVRRVPDRFRMRDVLFPRYAPSSLRHPLLSLLRAGLLLLGALYCRFSLVSLAYSSPFHRDRITGRTVRPGWRRRQRGSFDRLCRRRRLRTGTPPSPRCPPGRRGVVNAPRRASVYGIPPSCS